MKTLKDWLFGEVSVTAVCAAVSVACLAASLGGWLRPWLPLDAAWPAIVLCGGPIVFGAVRALALDRDVKADALVALALLASLAAGAWFAAGEVALIMQTGSLLEGIVSKRAGGAVEAMLALMPQTAHVVRDAGRKTVPILEVRVGDVLAVLAGERVPTDGVVLSGRATLSEAIMTGESAPVDKVAGDRVISGTTNEAGPFTMRAEAACAESSLQRMAALTAEAQAARAPIARAADRWAGWLVGVALACAALAWLFTGYPIRAVTVLVVFCPCAFVLATPTAIAAGIARAARSGVLIRSGEALERLSRVDEVALDKTGTLTEGSPSMAEVRALAADRAPTEVLALAAAAEQMSEHPLDRAIASALECDGGALPSATGFETRAGQGVSAMIKGASVLVGMRELLANAGVDTAGAAGFAELWQSRGATAVLVAADGRLVGAIALADALREHAAEAIGRLRADAISTMMLTGDGVVAAATAASRAGIEEIHAALRPADKLSVIAVRRAAGVRVCMVGDGVNDAPALSAAWAGISMGGIGSDIAVRAASAILVSDDISQLPCAFELARRTMGKVRQSIVIGLLINLVAVVLSVPGVLTPLTAALWHNCGSVFVVLNAATLLRKGGGKRGSSKVRAARKSRPPHHENEPTQQGGCPHRPFQRP